MAPRPVITAFDDHLFDTGWMPSKNINSNPAIVSSSSSLKLSSSQYFCDKTTRTSEISTSAILHDHSYVLKQCVDNVIDNRSDDNDHLLAFDEQIDVTSIDFEDFMMCTETDDAIVSQKEEYAMAAINDQVMTVASNSRLPNSDSKLADCADDDEMFTDEFDFLHGLDDLHLDLGGFDPSADMAMEDTFEKFIDETLNNPLSRMAEEEDECHGSGSNDDEEERQRKEFFLKLLGLQAVPADVQQKESSYPERQSLPPLDILIDVHSPTPEESNPSSSSCKDSTADFYDDSWCSKNYQNSCHASQNYAGTPFSNVCTPLSNCVTSVPAKMCSCAVSDWKSSVLYSTAPVGSQTSLSTASPHSPVDNLIENGSFGFSNRHVPYPGDNDCNDLNSLHSNSISVLGVCQRTPDKVADEFLRWLDLEEEEEKPSEASSPLAIAAAAATAISDGSNGHDDHSSLYTLEVVNSVPEPLTPSTVHSTADLDSFIDLEDFVADCSQSSPTYVPVNEDGDRHNYGHERVPATRFEVTDKQRSALDYNKHPSQYSEFRFRLSLLDKDLSKSFVNHRASEKSDTLGTSFCPSGFGFRQDHTMDFSFDSVSSPLSPCSPASVQSPCMLSSKRVDDSLDLLGLFSEENSSLLM